MGYPTNVQLIKRQESEQWYINFPAALAQAMEFERGETVEWTVEDKAHLLLRRLRVPASAMEKNGHNDCGVRAPFRPDPASFRPRAYFCAGQDPGPERIGRAGTAHRERHALRQRSAVQRLVGRLPPL